MIVGLVDFSYYFSLIGRDGGLHSLDCDFKLRPEPGETTEDVKESMRGLVRSHTQLYDRLYDEVVPGKREPTLTDTPHTFSTGYSYEGRLTTWSKKRLESRLAPIFGQEAIDPRGERSVYASLRVSIECSARKDGSGFEDATVRTKYNLNHTLNVCFFRFIQGIDGISVVADAARSITALDRTLESEWEREGRDHYRTMIAKD